MQKSQYKRIINDLSHRHSISIVEWRNDDSGWANRRLRAIAIPEPKSINKFITCLHEFGHILNDKPSNPIWKSEYLAYQYAFDFCDQHNIKVTKTCEIQAQNYIKFKVCKSLNYKPTLSKISPEVLKFVKINSTIWRRKLEENKVPVLRCTYGMWKKVRIDWKSKPK